MRKELWNTNCYRSQVAISQKQQWILSKSTCAVIVEKSRIEFIYRRSNKRSITLSCSYSIIIISVCSRIQRNLSWTYKDQIECAEREQLDVYIFPEWTNFCSFFVRLLFCLKGGGKVVPSYVKQSSIGGFFSILDCFLKTASCV